MVVHGPASIFGSPASCGTLPRCCKHVWYQWQHLLPPPRKLHGGASRPLAPPPPRFASLLLPQLLARQRIPSGQYADPLGHIFDEFDKDRRWVQQGWSCSGRFEVCSGEREDVWSTFQTLLLTCPLITYPQRHAERERGGGSTAQPERGHHKRASGCASGCLCIVQCWVQAAGWHRSQQMSPRFCCWRCFFAFVALLLQRRRLPVLDIGGLVGYWGSTHVGAASMFLSLSLRRVLHTECLFLSSVSLTEMFIEAVDFQRHAITKDEFRELIMHMAAADLHSRRSAQQQVRCARWVAAGHAVGCGLGRLL